MKFADINKVFTQCISEYIAQGYTINAGTMGGSQGEIAHVDLTDGEKIIRVLMSEERSYENGGRGEYVRVLVGEVTNDVKPNVSEYGPTVWNQDLAPIAHTDFWVVGDSRKGKFYGTKREALEANRKRQERYKNNSDTRGSVKRLPMTSELEKHLKAYIRRKTGKTRIYSGGIIAFRERNGKYSIAYQGETYALR